MDTVLWMLRFPGPTTRPPTAPRSRRVYDFPTETLLQYGHLRQEDAAKALGVAPITLKRICQRRKLRWPYRALRAKAKRLTKHEEADMPQMDKLPSYCVYTRPVSKDVPPLRVGYATARTRLPSLAETLQVSSKDVPTKPRPSLPRMNDQPQAEPVPILPALNLSTSPVAYRTPTYAAMALKKEPARPVLSPAMVRFRLLPCVELPPIALRSLQHI